MTRVARLRPALVALMLAAAARPAAAQGWLSVQGPLGRGFTLRGQAGLGIDAYSF